eukprot:1158747-Pelagomonas_calceolata.AAC.16
MPAYDTFAPCRKEDIPAVDNNRTTSLCCLMESLMQEARGFQFDAKEDEHVRRFGALGFRMAHKFMKRAELMSEQRHALLTRQALALIFTFAYVWSMGGNLQHTSQDEFDDFVREELQSVTNVPGVVRRWPGTHTSVCNLTCAMCTLRPALLVQWIYLLRDGFVFLNAQLALKPVASVQIWPPGFLSCSSILTLTRPKLAGSGTVFDYWVDMQSKGFPGFLRQWWEVIPPFEYKKDVPYFQMLVPTMDTVRCASKAVRLCLLPKNFWMLDSIGLGLKARYFGAVFQHLTELLVGCNNMCKQH